MSHHNMDRRKFMLTSAGVLTAGIATGGCAASAQEIEEAAAQVGRLPRRRFGNSGREVSALIGSATWSREAVEAGIRCGVNYWHKAEDWDSGAPEAILRHRDGHYCEICIDRVRGNHETGVIDEEAHYQLVKRAVRNTGLNYFDDLMFHFGYHSVAELKTNRAFIRLYERLKKEGLVRHLCLSQHSYQGNSRVPGGESSSTILNAVMQDGAYEHAQFAYTFGDNSAINNFVRQARQNGFGTVAMKTTGGAGRMLQDREFMKGFPAGASPHNALARWLTTQTELDTAIVQINNLRQFVDTYSGAGKTLRVADTQAIEQMTIYANREVCRLCNDCMSHCAQGLAIADILRYERYAQDYGELERARRLYAQLDKQADACIVCGNCLPHCTQGLPIARKLADVHRILT